MSVPTLFSPITVGNRDLNHRIVQSPMTRLRNTEDGVPQAHCVEYYKQRATRNGLLITEGTFISSTNNGYPFAPGIYTDAQVVGWKRVVDAVHEKGGIIFNQLWHVGRAGGVELHAAYGYLIDQFINSSSNIRMDEYGGSIENRARFVLEIIDAVVEAIGARNVAVRFSPWSEFQDMKDDTPVETWSYITQQLQHRHPDLAYLHFAEARATGLSDVDEEQAESLDPFRDIWKGPFVNCGGYNRTKAIQLCEEKPNNLVAFGRLFIANPDLVDRFRRNLPLNKYHRPTFYTQGTEGYTDYPVYSDTV